MKEANERETDAYLIHRYQETRKSYFRTSKKLDMMRLRPGRDRAERMVNNLKDEMAELRDKLKGRKLEGMIDNA